MPTYNRAHVITAAIHSVVKQSYSDFELLIVDDGSTDNTIEVIRAFSDPRIRYIRHERNKGVSAARNTGFREARGRLIGFLDSDDTWKPDKLEREMGFFDTYPEVQGVFSDLEKCDGGEYYSSFTRTSPVFSRLLSRKAGTDGIVLERREMYLCLLQEVPVKPSALTLRAGVVETVGFFDESRSSGEDWEFLIRLTRVACLGYIDRPLARLKVMADATHRLHLEEDHLRMWETLSEERRLLKQDPEGLEASRRGIIGLAKRLSWWYLSEDRRWDAVTVLLRGFVETGCVGLLLRAINATLPARLRALIRRSRTHSAARREVHCA